MTKDTIAHTTLSPSNTAAALLQCVQADKPVFLWGSPGIGKSEIARQVAESMGRPIIDIRLALYEPTDIKGIPFFDKDAGTMRWAPASDLPRHTDETKDAILFLDEMNSAPPSVQAAAYQLILNRRIGEYILPENVRIIAAGNLESDKGVTYRMPTPLANRFTHLHMEVSKDDWIQWAAVNDIHPSVVGYIEAHGQHLYTFDPKSPDKAFASPRSWTFVSDFLNFSSPENITMALVAGSVGQGTAIEFMSHLRLTHRLPKPEEILSGKVKKLDTDEPSAKYAMTVSLCYSLKDLYNIAKSPKETRSEHYKEFGMDQWLECMGNFFQFMANFEAEMAVLGGRLAFYTYKLPVDDLTGLDKFQKYYKKYGKLVIDNI